VAWWRDRVAVGLGRGDIYKVEGRNPVVTQTTLTPKIVIKPFHYYRQEFSQVPIIGKLPSAALSKAVYGKINLDALYASYQAYLKTLGLAESALKEVNETYYKGKYLKALIKVLEATTYLKISNIICDELLKTWNLVKKQMRSLNYNVPVPKVIEKLCNAKLKDWDSDVVISVLKKCIRTGPQGVELVKTLKPYGGLEAFAGSLALKDFGKEVKSLSPREAKLARQAEELKAEIEAVLGG